MQIFINHEKVSPYPPYPVMLFESYFEDMNDNGSSSNLTRRSFIKRSVVAGVAVSSMTIFSGLVNASVTHPSPSVKCSGSTCAWSGGPKTPDVSQGTCQNDDNQGCTCTWRKGDKDLEHEDPLWKDHWECDE